MKNSLLAFSLSALAVLVSISPCLASPLEPRALEVRNTPSLPLTVTTVHEFSFPSWCENLAVRCDGNLLVTRLDTPALYQIDPAGIVPPILVASWNSTFYKGALGISETVDNVFFVILAAPVDANFVKTSGIPAIYEVDMNTFSASSSGTVLSAATVTKLTDLPTADFPNGMTTLDNKHILVGDAYNGWVYKINTHSGAYNIAVNDPLMKFPPNSPINLGVNGIKISGSYLYWTNTGSSTLNKIKIDSNAAPIGSSSVVTQVGSPDDFIIKSDGTVFFAQNSLEELSALLPGAASPIVVAGSPTSTILAGVTAAQFGRLDSDSQRLYLTTNGGLAAPVNGTIVGPGKVAYVDTTGF